MRKRSDELQAEVLAVLRESNEPLSAYGVLDRLSAANRKIAPPTVYRALFALTERRYVHRLESLSAYIARRSEPDDGATVLSICNECGAVQENVAPDLMDRLSSLLGQKGFSALRHVVEVHGLCASCNKRVVTG